MIPRAMIPRTMIPRVASSWGGPLAWFAAGVASAVVVHYMLYRMGLPVEPFIYVAF